MPDVEPQDQPPGPYLTVLPRNPLPCVLHGCRLIRNWLALLMVLRQGEPGGGGNRNLKGRLISRSPTKAESAGNACPRYRPANDHGSSTDFFEDATGPWPIMTPSAVKAYPEFPAIRDKAVRVELSDGMLVCGAQMRWRIVKYHVPSVGLYLRQQLLCRPTSRGLSTASG